MSHEARSPPPHHDDHRRRSEERRLLRRRAGTAHGEEDRELRPARGLPLYFGDEQGSPGSILTWFEFAGAPQGTPGIGDIHTIQLGVGSEGALDFWAERLESRGYPSTRLDGALRFADYDGLQFELVVAADGNPALRAAHPEI